MRILPRKTEEKDRWNGGRGRKLQDTFVKSDIQLRSPKRKEQKKNKINRNEKTIQENFPELQNMSLTARTHESTLEENRPGSGKLFRTQRTKRRPEKLPEAGNVLSAKNDREV